jgi:hypothetical protein
MRKYKVWSETYGQREEDGRDIEADTPQQATETWARWFDDGVGDLEIINGKPATVTVKDIETGHVSHWFVHGEAVPVYTAKLRVGDGVTP